MKPIIVLLLPMILLNSCDKGRGTALVSYEMFIAGDSGKQVTISYMDIGDTYLPKNIQKTKVVTLPFYSPLTTVRIAGKHAYDIIEFLTVSTTKDDTTTKTVFFETDFKLNDSTPLYVVIQKYMKDSAFLGDEYANINYPIDSIWSYFKKINYPCYMEFKGDATTKTVLAKDLNNWRQNNTP